MPNTDYWSFREQIIIGVAVGLASLMLSGVTLGNLAFRSVLLKYGDCDADWLQQWKQNGKEALLPRQVEVAINDLFVYSLLFVRFGSLLMGLALDIVGPRIVAMMGSLIATCGYGLMASSKLSLDAFYHGKLFTGDPLLSVGFILAAVGGQCIHAATLYLPSMLCFKRVQEACEASSQKRRSIPTRDTFIHHTGDSLFEPMQSSSSSPSSSSSAGTSALAETANMRRPSVCATNPHCISAAPNCSSRCIDSPPRHRSSSSQDHQHHRASLSRSGAGQHEIDGNTTSADLDTTTTLTSTEPHRDQVLVRRLLASFTVVFALSSGVFVYFASLIEILPDIVVGWVGGIPLRVPMILHVFAGLLSFVLITSFFPPLPQVHQQCRLERCSPECAYVGLKWAVSTPSHGHHRKRNQSPDADSASASESWQGHQKCQKSSPAAHWWGPLRLLPRSVFSPNFWVVSVSCSLFAVVFDIFLGSITMRIVPNILQQGVSVKLARGLMSDFTKLFPFGSLVVFTAVAQMTSSNPLSVSFLMAGSIILGWTFLMEHYHQVPQTFSFLAAGLLRPFFFSVANQIGSRLVRPLEIGRSYGSYMFISGIFLLPYLPLMRVGGMQSSPQLDSTLLIMMKMVLIPVLLFMYFVLRRMQL